MEVVKSLKKKKKKTYYSSRSLPVQATGKNGHSGRLVGESSSTEMFFSKLAGFFMRRSSKWQRNPQPTNVDKNTFLGSLITVTTIISRQIQSAELPPTHSRPSGFSALEVCTFRGTSWNCRRFSASEHPKAQKGQRVSHGPKLSVFKKCSVYRLRKHLPSWIFTCFTCSQTSSCPKSAHVVL